MLVHWQFCILEHESHKGVLTMDTRKILIVVVGIFMLSTTNVFAGPMEGVPCKGDFNYDGSVASDDVATFIAHTGRNTFNDPCPSDGPAPWRAACPSFRLPGPESARDPVCSSTPRPCRRHDTAPSKTAARYNPDAPSRS